MFFSTCSVSVYGGFKNSTKIMYTYLRTRKHHEKNVGDIVYIIFSLQASKNIYKLVPKMNTSIWSTKKDLTFAKVKTFYWNSVKL